MSFLIVQKMSFAVCYIQAVLQPFSWNARISLGMFEKHVFLVRWDTISALNNVGGLSSFKGDAQGLFKWIPPAQHKIYAIDIPPTSRPDKLISVIALELIYQALLDLLCVQCKNRRYKTVQSS